MIKKLLLFSCLALVFNSCVVVKEYEKVNINDPDMALFEKKSNRYETTAQAYREAAVGANGGKTGGGCGCN